VSICKCEEITTQQNAEKGRNVSKTIDQNWADALAGSRQRFLLRAGEVACTGRGTYWTFSEQYFVGAFAVRSGNDNISTQSVSRGFPLRCLRVLSCIAYGISKLIRFTDRKEETEAKNIFLLTWEHERWNSDLAKDISRRKQHSRCNSKTRTPGRRIPTTDRVRGLPMDRSTYFPYWPPLQTTPKNRIKIIINYYPTAANSIQIAVQIYSDIVVICTVENLFAVQVGARTQNCHTLPLFSDKFIDYSSWIINLLLDVLVCSIALYFHSLSVR